MDSLDYIKHAARFPSAKPEDFSARVNFQHALMDCARRGILLAIVSKNNPEDVKEVFEKNPAMVLREKDFAAVQIGWGDKADGIIAIAKELNIGTDAMIFLDDDPVNRATVRARLPEVAVPEFTLAPESYVDFLYGLDLFSPFPPTEEDRARSRMYAEERERKHVAEAAKTVEEYIAELGIVIDARMNDRASLERLAQLTQKTNQFNATTKRYAEHDIERFMEDGWVMSARVADRFGDYGIVILAIALPEAGREREAALDTFLMSCRTMGRGVECVFLDQLVRVLAERGIQRISATFVPTAKNAPAATFFEEHGFELIKEENSTKHYALDTAHYLAHPCAKVNKAITINL